jgi:UDP-N-acetylglucosamine 3-dehydrogenase
MPTYDVAVIGTGPGEDSTPEDAHGYETTDPSPSSMGFRHGQRYADIEACELVACADLVEEHAETFADTFGFDAANAYTDHRAMLAEVKPDMVSVCTPVPATGDIVVDCAKAGVAAVHTEKPMGYPWGDCRLMAQECARRGVQLTVSHQQRVSGSARRARELIEEGAIGEVTRVEMTRGNLFDAGTHQVDMCNYFAGDQPADWVLGQIDYSEEYVKKGVPQENQAFALWEYPDGVNAVAATGIDGAVEANNRIVGTEGVIERDNGAAELGLRQWEAGDWETVDCEDTDDLMESIGHAVDCLDTGEEPLHGARRALNASEIIFAIRESSRRRGRVDLPLTVDEDPLAAMVESGELSPTPRE